MDERRVLILEEDREIRRLIRRLCELEGLVVQEATSPSTAMDVAAVFGPQVAVVSNFHNGVDGDGETAAYWIRSVSPNTRIVAFSVVSTERPTWADSFLGKMDLLRMSPLLKELS